MRLKSVLILFLAAIPLKAQQSPIPPQATHCDISAPIEIELVPIDTFQVGRTARFQVRIESNIDPSLVQRMWVEYETPERLRAAPGLSRTMEVSKSRGPQRYEYRISVPDRKRYEVRARLKVQFLDGTTMGRTAVRFVDVGRNPPDGMIGRMTNPDGSGIRIYQGQPIGD